MRRWPALVSAAVLLIAGAVLAWIGFMDRSAEEIPWGLLIPGYVFFALMATGSSIVNSVYTVFGYKGPNGEYEKIIKLGVVLADNHRAGLDNDIIGHKAPAVGD